VGVPLSHREAATKPAASPNQLLKVALFPFFSTYENTWLPPPDEISSLAEESLPLLHSHITCPPFSWFIKSDNPPLERRRNPPAAVYRTRGLPYAINARTTPTSPKTGNPFFFADTGERSNSPYGQLRPFFIEGVSPPWAPAAGYELFFHTSSATNDTFSIKDLSCHSSLFCLFPKDISIPLARYTRVSPFGLPPIRPLSKQTPPPPPPPKKPHQLWAPAFFLSLKRTWAPFRPPEPCEGTPPVSPRPSKSRGQKHPLSGKLDVNPLTQLKPLIKTVREPRLPSPKEADLSRSGKRLPPIKDMLS